MFYTNFIRKAIYYKNYGVTRRVVIPKNTDLIDPDYPWMNT